MGGGTLKTSLRQVKELDILVAQESPPPPTFTVPAFRARKHRGGESELLTHTYPSGFCKPPENRPLPTTTKTSASSTIRRHTLPLSGPQLRDLLHESKEVGVTPCGAAAGRQALNVTRVVIGAKDVVEAVGSELVQYAGFSVGPAELSSPTSVNRACLSRPPSPVSPSRMTIDGSALLRGRNSLLVEARTTTDNEWSGRKTCAAPGDFASPRDDVLKGRKRVRSATLGRAQSSSGPEPWPYPAEVLTGRSSRPSTSASTKRRGPGGVAAAALRVNDGENCAQQPRGKPLGGKEGPARPGTRESVTKHGVSGDRDQNTHSPTETATAAADQAGFPGAQQPENPPSVQEETPQAGCRDETATQATEGELALPLPSEGQPNGSGSGSGGGRAGGVWAKDKDYPSVWSDSDSDGGGNGSSSTLKCFVAPAGTHHNDNGNSNGSGNDKDNNSSVFCGSLVSVANDGSAELAAGKGSFSTLDMERYRGSLLSRDATNILRSHLESRNVPPGSCTSFVSDGRNAIATEGSVMTSPAPPPSPPGQHLDNFFAEGRQHSAPYYVPPGRAPETCYVRTRGDIVLAVVRKKELLECDGDAGLRTLKTAAHPVRIKADMSMAEGMRAILASGVLHDCGAAVECDRLVGGRRADCRSSRAGAVDGTRGTRGRPRALEYFNSQEGGWQLVRNESDWKILLAAQSSPQGAGVVFQRGGANGRGADFLVAVTSLPPQAQPREHGKSQPMPTTWYRSAPGKLRAAQARYSNENGVGWRYASLVTPGALRPLGRPSDAAHDTDGSDARRKAAAARTPCGAAARDPTEPQRNGAQHEGDGPALPKAVPLPRENDLEAEGGDGEDAFRRKLAGLDRGRRRRIGSGPGGALWTPTASKAAVGKGEAAGGSPSRRPKKAKVRRLVRHLEAGLKLKGRPGAGGLPPVGSQRVDLPYTKELAKWSYDEILGIPKVTVPAKPPEL